MTLIIIYLGVNFSKSPNLSKIKLDQNSMLIGRKIMPDFITKAKELGLVKDASPVDIVLMRMRLEARSWKLVA